MTVSIRMTSDTAGLQAGIKAVQEQYQRLQRQIQSMNREAREFEKIDLRGVGGDVAAGFEKAQRQWQELLNAIPQLRKRMEASGQGGRAPWDIDWNRMYGSRQTASAQQRHYMDQVLRGTPWAGGGGGGDFGGGGGDPGGGGGGGRMGGLFGTGMKMMGVMAGVGGAASTVMSGYNAAIQTGQATDLFVRRTRSAGEAFITVRDRLQKLGDGLGMTNAESANLAVQFGKAANEVDQTRVIEGARQAGGFARGFGMDPTGAAQGIGKLSLYGVGRDAGGQRQMMLMLGKTISQGMFGGKGEMVIEKLGQHVESFARSTMKAPGDVGDFLNIMTAMGKMRDTHPGMAMHGMDVMQQMTANLQLKGSESSQFATVRALQESGMFKGASPYEMMYKAGELTASTKMDNGKYGFQVLTDSVKKHLGGKDPYQAAVLGGSLLGITPQQFQALDDLSTELKKQGAQDTFEKALGGKNIDITQLKADAIKDIGDALSADEKTLRGIGAERGIAGADTMGINELRDAIIKDAAETGRQKTEISENVDATKNLKDQIEQTTEKLIPVVTKAAEAMGKVAAEASILSAKIVELISPISAIATKFGWKPPTANPEDSVYKATGGLFQKTGGGLLSYFDKKQTPEQRIEEAQAGIKKIEARPADYGPASVVEKEKKRLQEQIDTAQKEIDAQKAAPAPVGGSATQKAAEAYAASGGRSGPLSSSKKSFVEANYEAAAQTAESMGVKPETLLAVAAHESNWGKSAPGGNLFGIKEARKGKGGNTTMTSEVRNGQVVRESATWEEHGTPQQSFAAYEAFLRRNPRYKDALAAAEAGDDEGFLKKVHEAGYATDPKYADKILKTKKSIEGKSAVSKSAASKEPNVPRDQFGNRTFPILDEASQNIYDSYTPIDGPDMPPAQASAKDKPASGKLDVNIHMLDRDGKEKAKVEHRQGLGKTSPTGSVDVQQSWMDAI